MVAQKHWFKNICQLAVRVNKKQLATVVCPECKSLFKLVYIAVQRGDDVDGGVVRCSCGEYPIIAGILVLKKSRYVQHAVSCIYEQKSREAVLSVIEFGSAVWKRVLVRMFRTEFIFNDLKNRVIMKIMKLVQPRYVKSDCTFREATAVWGLWGHYLDKRFESKSFFVGSLVFNEHASKIKKGDKVLDVCCGVGHFENKFEGTVPDAEIFCCDKHFVNLYFLKKYFSKKAAVICCNANKKLPFQNDFFSLVFNSDSFHYLDNQSSCCGEVFRVLRKKGRIIFTHLHNKLVHNCGQGDAKTYTEYSILFEKFYPWIFSEKKLLMEFLLSGKIDLRKGHDGDKVQGSNAFVLLGKKD